MMQLQLDTMEAAAAAAAATAVALGASPVQTARAVFVALRALPMAAASLVQAQTFDLGVDTPAEEDVVKDSLEQAFTLNVETGDLFESNFEKFQLAEVENCHEDEKRDLLEQAATRVVHGECEVREDDADSYSAEDLVVDASWVSTADDDSEKGIDMQWKNDVLESNESTFAKEQFANAGGYRDDTCVVGSETASLSGSPSTVTKTIGCLWEWLEAVPPDIKESKVGTVLNAKLLALSANRQAGMMDDELLGGLLDAIGDRSAMMENFGHRLVML